MILLNTIKRELNALGIKPKKSLGQNFLVNEGIYKKIVAALEIKEGDTVIEVGPGLGTLTRYLAESGVKVIAIEKDHRLTEYLRHKLANQKNVEPFAETKNNSDIKGLPMFQQKAESRTENSKHLQSLSKFSGARVTIVEDDILKFNPKSYKLSAISYKLVGNIPYYLSSRLIRTVFEKWPHPEKIVLMVQKEVAQRIVAKPPEMSLLAVSVQYYARPEITSYVSAGSFYPSPKVDSAIIKLTPRLQVTGYRLQEKDGNKKPETWPLKPETFFRVVRAGFTGKRKQLINNLATGLKISKQEIRQKLLPVGINPQRRAETLTIEEWQKITNSLFSRD